MIATLLLAAGRSTRMGGRDKLLEPIQGRAILQILADRALVHGPTYVTLPSANHPRRAVLPKAAKIVVVNGQMSDSLRAGINALPNSCAGVIILPADMPDITSADLQKFHDAAATGVSIARGETSDGHPGHPVYIAAHHFDMFRYLTGDRGAHSVLLASKEQTMLIQLAEDRARLDLDTPEDWAAYRKRAAGKDI